jgi:predicted RNA-binding protein YlxR (DUF448 family)
MCVVCRQKGGKRRFTRLVRTEQGVMIDPSGKMNGRGAYVCDQANCWERAVKTDIVAKALKIALTDEDRVRLRAGLLPPGTDS